MPATETLRVTTADKKYTVIQMSDGTSHALRYGDAWQVYPEGKSVGNLALALAHDLEAVRKELSDVKFALANVEALHPDV